MIVLPLYLLIALTLYLTFRFVDGKAQSWDEIKYRIHLSLYGWIIGLGVCMFMSIFYIDFVWTKSKNLFRKEKKKLPNWY